jgi:CO/xanthine dehydrogenase FAD-binding subunit
MILDLEWRRMKPPRFHYERPDSVSAVLDRLASDGDRAKVLAGGQSLVALMNLRLASPEIVVDIGRLEELRYVRAGDAMLDVGALTTQATVEKDPSIAEICPLLAEAIGYIGHSAIRNRGTVGGSIAHADPAAELPLVLMALDGEVTVASSGGSRRIAAKDFFRGFLTTAVEPTELVTEVSFPRTEVSFPRPDRHAGFAFEQFARRPGDFGLVSVACRVAREDDSIASARVVLGGVGHAPVVVKGLDELRGASGEEAAVAAGEAAAAIDVVADVHGSAAYRSHLARRLTERAVRRAVAERS